MLKRISAQPMYIPLSNPDITERERKAVYNTLKTPSLSLGPKLDEFESIFASYLGIPHAIAVSSGTAALHLCIKALGIGADDEVITTPFSFVASANCILYERAKPVFADIDPETLNINAEQIIRKINHRTKAILAVDVFGLPSDWDKLRSIARNNHLYLIEDSAESLGAEYKGKKTGTFGDFGIFGFYPNKQITTGEGGMIVTHRKKLANLCHSLRNQGRDQGMGWLAHQRLGYNYRLSDINCALGIAQLERINEILRKREKVASYYNRILAKMEGIKTPTQSLKAKRSWFVYVIQLDEKFKRQDRDRILKELTSRGIGCNSYFPPIHLQPFYQKELGYRKGDFPITERVSDRTVALPFFGNLKKQQIEFVCHTLQHLIK